MALFLSTYSNKLDKKGRISVPAPFREQLKSESFKGIVAYGSFINECVESCGISRIAKINESIDDLDPYSEERDAFATTLMAGSFQLAFDGDGRITMPPALIEITGISSETMFVGKGSTFEIWEPQRYNEYYKKAKALAASKRGSLKLNSKQE